MPFLLVAISFFSFAQFLGSIYSANKKTSMAFATNLIGVAVSLTFNIILVSVLKVGIIGSAIATLCSYFVLWIVRIRDTGKIVPIKYNVKKMTLATVILVLQAIVVTVSADTVITYIISGAAFLALIVIFMKDMLGLVKFGLSFLTKILKRGA